MLPSRFLPIEKRRRYTLILDPFNPAAAVRAPHDFSSSSLTPTLIPNVLCIASQPEEIVGETLLASSTLASSAAEGLELLRSRDFDVVLVSLPLLDCISAAGLLEELQQTQPATPVVLHAPGASSTDVVRLLRLGAFHVYAHGDSTSLLFLAANSKWARETSAGSQECEEGPWRRFLIGDSRPMQQVAQQSRWVAPRRSTVLITGETGTGKELVARSVHAASTRHRSSMV